MFTTVAGNGADALDIISYSRFATVQGNSYVISILLILFSVSLTQFCIDTLATAEQKHSDVHIIVETDLWASLVIIITGDMPFLAMRLFLMTNYQVGGWLKGRWYVCIVCKAESESEEAARCMAEKSVRCEVKGGLIDGHDIV